jgi:hypothetical protein
LLEASSLLGMIPAEIVSAGQSCMESVHDPGLTF